MNKLVGALLFSLLTACGDPQCGPGSYGSLVIAPASTCLTVDLPAPLTEEEPCSDALVTVHNACTDDFVVKTTGGSGAVPALDVAPGTDRQIEPSVDKTSSKTATYTITGTLGSQSVTITFDRTDT